MEDAVGPALDVDSKPAFLFESEGGELLGVSLRADGADLPPGGSGEPWRFRCTFLLGVHEPVPETVDPWPILRGVAARGYFVWQGREPWAPPSCGTFKYWNGEYCADARDEPSKE